MATVLVVDDSEFMRRVIRNILEGGGHKVIEARNSEDAIKVFSWLFTGGTAPEPPAPSEARYAPGDCGVDPTPDDGMDCVTEAPTCE